MHKPESVLENETHKILWDFEIQTDHLITARRPDLVLINKKKRTCHFVDFAVPADHRVRLKERQILGPGQRTEKTVEHEGESRTNSNWCPRNNKNNNKNNNNNNNNNKKKNKKKKKKKKKKFQNYRHHKVVRCQSSTYKNIAFKKKKKTPSYLAY